MTFDHLEKMTFGQEGEESIMSSDREIYVQFQGKMVKVNEPTCSPDKYNFVIQYKGRDWTGFRTLDYCEKQFEYLENRDGDFFTVIQR